MEGCTLPGLLLGKQTGAPSDKTETTPSCPQDKKRVEAVLGAGWLLPPVRAQLCWPALWRISVERVPLVQWTEQCQAVFVQVQKTLCGEPLLSTPNLSLSFILQIDALNRGLGALLSQQVRGVDRPVVYISRKLLATQCVSCPLCATKI